MVSKNGWNQARFQAQLQVENLRGHILFETSSLILIGLRIVHLKPCLKFF